MVNTHGQIVTRPAVTSSDSGAQSFHQALFAPPQSPEEAAARVTLGVTLHLSEAQIEIINTALRFLLTEGADELCNSLIDPEDFAEIGEQIEIAVIDRPAYVRAFLSEGD